jgi:hypothetical protein
VPPKYSRERPRCAALRCSTTRAVCGRSSRAACGVDAAAAAAVAVPVPVAVAAAQRSAAERASCTGEAKFLLGSVLLEFGLHADARTALLEAEVLKPNLRDDQIRELAQLLARTTGGP